MSVHALLTKHQPAGTEISHGAVEQERYEIWYRPAKGNSKERFYSLRGKRCNTREAAAAQTKAERFRPV